MNEEIERRLQSERGPREEGYAPILLPASLDAGRQGDWRGSRLLSAATLVGVAAAGVLAVIFVGGILSGPGPDIGGRVSAAPSPAASGGGGTCEQSDITFTAEPWGGAAGSRGTTITIALAPERPACRLSRLVSVQIEDANGNVLVGMVSLVAGGPVLLEPGAAYAGGAAWSNWCAGAPASPVTLAVRLGSWPPVWVPVDVPAGGVSPVPPCSGQGPSLLGGSTFELQP